MGQKDKSSLLRHYMSWFLSIVNKPRIETEGILEGGVYVVVGMAYNVSVAGIFLGTKDGHIVIRDDDNSTHYIKHYLSIIV